MPRNPQGNEPEGLARQHRMALAEARPDETGERISASYPTASSVDIHRALPHSVEAEQGVLGSMLISPRDAIADVVEKINENYFYIPAHQTVYNVLVDLWNAGQGIDLITFTQILRDRNLLDTVGGAPFVTSLFTFVPTAANVGYYLEIVRDKYILREIISACTEGARRSYEEQDEVDNLLDEVEQKIFAVGEDRFKDKALSMKDQVMDAIEAIEKLYQQHGGITGLATGFKDLDRLTSGLHPAEMIVIAARPSMGKTALAMNIAEHVAVNENRPVAVFSLEMSAQQLVQRLLCSRAGVNSQKVRDGTFLAERDFPKLDCRGLQAGRSKNLHRRQPGPEHSRAARQGATAEGAARHRADRDRLPATPPLHLAPRTGQSPDRNFGNLRRHQGARERVEHPDHRRRPAQSKSGKPHRRQQRPAASERPARIGQHRAGRRSRGLAR